MELRKISPEELQEILWKHEMWLNVEEGGECANLERANLVRANLTGAYLTGAYLTGANLVRANLERAHLEGANLTGANLDYSCLPLWCGSLQANFDDRQLKQIAYHLVRAGLQSNNASDETKSELAKLVDFANQFHRVKECGEIKLDA